ncbi:MAG TPA: hypothetical protein VFY73_21360 [Ideonella sp.]|uniref:hypothetical protein n=1 Tax=Ideonella sp. TaxID=1929293 RepID=UPI002E322B7E|nr:hypothetical protein [Ideonella sp.]HEX5686582.1 hypothetical protein [Ideonella sp.]
MSPRLLRLYTDELPRLQEVGAEFMRESAKKAASMGLRDAMSSGPEVARSSMGGAETP